MNKIALICCLLLATSYAHPSPKSKDHKKLDELFQSAELYGARLVKCGRESEKEQMFLTIDYLENAYSQLNRDFPVFTPSLVMQLEPRFEAICRAIDCRIIDTTSPSCGYFTGDDEGVAEIMRPFEQAHDDAKKRLPKRKGATRIDASGESCPKSAQYYQDAYESRGRVSDLECFRVKLQRQYGH